VASGVLVIIALAGVFWLVEVVRAKIAGRPRSWETFQRERAERSADSSAPPESVGGVQSHVMVDREPGMMGRAYFGVGTPDPWAHLTPQQRDQALRRMRPVIWVLIALPVAITAVTGWVTQDSHTTIGVGISFGVVFLLVAGWLELDRRRRRKADT